MEDTLSDQRRKWLYLFIGLAALINFSGLFVTIIGPDGTLYATIAKTMAVTNNFTELFAEGKDWLDKPHFPFWMAALFFKAFGYTSWAYKLPAVLFVLMAAWYTYKLAIELYTEEIALWSALILLSSQHLILSNMDVRAEPYLTGLLIASVYHFYRSQRKEWFLHLVLGALFAACAVMTKGIFALIPVFGAIAGNLLIKKQWSMLFNFRWLLAVAMIFIFILPELWCLYVQFDAHPEKVIFGQTNVSGLKFFFWDSQFGRFFNIGPIKKSNGDPSFFLHTTLWAFLPWSILFYVAVVQFFRKSIKSVEKEWLCLCGAGLTFLIFSASKFQLPHYITIIFPFFSILTAQYICGIKSERSFLLVTKVQGTVAFLMTLIILLLNKFFNPDFSAIAIGLLLLTLALFIVSFYLIKDRFSVFYLTVVVVLFVNVYFNLVYYPALTLYQSDSQAAFWLNKYNKKHLPLVKVNNNYFHAIDFYSNQPVLDYLPGEEHLLPAKPYILFAETETIDQMRQAGVKLESLKTFESFQITRVNAKFLNYNKRKEVMNTSQLVLIK